MNNLAKCFLILSTASFTTCSIDEDVPSSNPDTASDNYALFDDMWKTFDEKYPYFELKNIDWDSMYSATRPRINNELSDIELGEIFKEVTLSLRDIHVLIEVSGKVTSYRKRQLYKPNLPDNAVNYLVGIKNNNNRILFADIEKSNIAYAY